MKKKNPNYFRTVIKTEKYPFNINYDNLLMFIGSCFTENIGSELQKYKFNVEINPFGILYNPISIKKGIEFLYRKKQFSCDDLFFHNGCWHSPYYHGRFSFPDKNKTLDNINNTILKSSNYLKNAEFIFITFGTATVYETKEKNELVSNCHKLPAANFKRRLLNTEEIVIEYLRLINILKNINPKLKIIFTISPVRHIQDGLTGNFLSKSILMNSVMQIVKKIKNTFYFPAYEIMIDDLRDYRFYASDMLHPNETAINYIFGLFLKSFVNKKTHLIMNEIEQIIKAKNHKPINPDTNLFKDFVRKNISKINKLSTKYPEISFKEEKEYFENF